MILDKKPFQQMLATTALAVCTTLTTGGAHASGLSGLGTTEPSDSICVDLQPTIYVKEGVIVGGRYDGRQYRGFLIGTHGDDIIFGTDGNDRVFGASGDDTICTFSGRDKIYAQSAKIVAYGGLGHDSIYGGKHADQISGGSGNDRLYGGKGSDALAGGAGTDFLIGLSGDDTLDGGAGDDRLFGDSGNDRLDGGLDYDRVYGGANSDTCGGELVRSCEKEIESEITTITVADVVSLNASVAESALSPLAVDISTAFDANVLAGLVMSQSPAADTEIAPDSTVNIVISQGPSSVVAGRVTNPAGEALPGIIVNAINHDSNSLGSISDTDSNGEFALTVSASGSYTLRLFADDYADQVVIVNSPDAGEISLDISMIPREAKQSFDEDAGGTLTGPLGAKVTVSPNSFEADAGTGDIQVSITPLDVSNLATLAAFPGDFSGVGDLGSSSPIAPLGTVEFDFTDANGNPINLLEGQTADIEIPLYINTLPEDGSAVADGQAIAVWSLNEDTGIWTQEGNGIVVASSQSPTGLALAATVSHFSWWRTSGVRL